MVLLPISKTKKQGLRKVKSFVQIKDHSEFSAYSKSVFIALKKWLLYLYTSWYSVFISIEMNYQPLIICKTQ